MSLAWTQDRRAQALLPRRDQLLEDLTRVLPHARALTDDERELVIDDALTHVVVEYQGEIHSTEEAERLFWSVARIRVNRALDGRHATVRGRFARASDEALKHIADHTSDPAALAEATASLDLAADFAASLPTIERQVLRVQWLSAEDDEPAGYRRIAAELNLTTARVRAAERTIGRQLERFIALLDTGGLCEDRAAIITAAAAGDRNAGKLARAHVKHCSACRDDYIAQLRAARSADFQRRAASFIPVAPLADSARRHGGPVRDLIADWAGRLANHDITATTAQAAATGVGRGTGSILAIKIAALLASGAAVVGVATSVIDRPADTRPPRRERAAATPTPTPTPTPRATATPKPIATPDLAGALAAARRAAKRHATQVRQQQQAQQANGPTSHERATAVSPAPAGSLPNGQSEFTPQGANLPPAGPAPAVTAPGASEFGP